MSVYIYWQVLKMPRNYLKWTNIVIEKRTFVVMLLVTSYYRVRR